MALNLRNKNTYYYVDKYNMMLTQSDGKGDSVGRTALAFIAYKWWVFLGAVYSCFEWGADCHKEIEKPYFIFRRHPEWNKNDMSRDHLSYALIMYKYAKRKNMVIHICKHLRWKISNKYNMTLDLWLWTRALYSKFWLFIFVNFQCLHMSIMSLWNCIIMQIMKVSPEYTEQKWDLNITRNRTYSQKKLSKWLFPAYAIHNLAWQLYVLDRKPWLLRKIVLTMTGKTNYLVRLLLGGKVTKEQVCGYQSMTGYRWSTRLDETNDRHVELLPPQEANDLEKDLLIEMWNETHKP